MNPSSHTCWQGIRNYPRRVAGIAHLNFQLITNSSIEHNLYLQIGLSSIAFEKNLFEAEAKGVTFRHTDHCTTMYKERRLVMLITKKAVPTRWNRGNFIAVAWAPSFKVRLDLATHTLFNVKCLFHLVKNY